MGDVPQNTLWTNTGLFPVNTLSLSISFLCYFIRKFASETKVIEVLHRCCHSGPRCPIARTTSGKSSPRPSLLFTLLSALRIVGVEKEKDGFGDFPGSESLHSCSRQEAADPVPRATGAAEGSSWTVRAPQGRSQPLGTNAQSTTELALPWREAGLYRTHLQ